MTDELEFDLMPRSEREPGAQPPCAPRQWVRKSAQHKAGIEKAGEVFRAVPSTSWATWRLLYGLSARPLPPKW